MITHIINPVFLLVFSLCLSKHMISYGSLTGFVVKRVEGDYTYPNTLQTESLCRQPFMVWFDYKQS